MKRITCLLWLVLAFPLWSAEPPKLQEYRGKITQEVMGAFEVGYCVTWKDEKLRLVLSSPPQLGKVIASRGRECDLWGYRGRRGNRLYFYVVRVQTIE